jgi:hypothetical protein
MTSAPTPTPVRPPTSGSMPMRPRDGIIGLVGPSKTPATDAEANRKQAAHKHDSGPRVGNRRPNPAQLYWLHQAGPTNEDVSPLRTTATAQKTGQKPFLTASYHSLRIRLDQRSRRGKAGQKSPFSAKTPAQRSFFRPETIFLGCIFIPRASNRRRFRHLVPGSGSRWGTTAHNFLAFWR